MKSRSKKSSVRVPVQDRSIEKKQHIINAAYELFSTMGYDGVNVRMIAEKSGVSVGTIYSYFSDKSEIFIEAAKLYVNKIYVNISEIIRKDIDPSENLEDSIYKAISEVSGLIKQDFIIHKDIFIKSLTDMEIQQWYLHEQAEKAELGIRLFIDLYRDKIRINYDSVPIFIAQKIIINLIRSLLLFKLDIDEERVFRELARMFAYYLERGQ